MTSVNWMRCVIGGAAVALGLVAAVSPAMAQSERFYVSGAIGGYFREGVSGPDSFFRTDDPSSKAPGSDRIGFSPDVMGSIALGYRLTRHLRVEGELAYFRYHADTLNPSTNAAGFPELDGQTFRRQSGDDYSRFTGTVNAFYDIATFAGRYTPYVGVGVGASDDHQSQGLFQSADQTPFTVSGGSSTQGLVLAEGGVAVALSPRLSLAPAYRYVHFFESNEDRAHIVKLGLRYAF